MVFFFGESSIFLWTNIYIYIYIQYVLFCGCNLWLVFCVTNQLRTHKQKKTHTLTHHHPIYLNLCVQICSIYIYGVNIYFYSNHKPLVTNGYVVCRLCHNQHHIYTTHIYSHRRNQVSRRTQFKKKRHHHIHKPQRCVYLAYADQRRQIHDQRRTLISKTNRWMLIQRDLLLWMDHNLFFIWLSLDDTFLFCPEVIYSIFFFFVLSKVFIHKTCCSHI